MAKNTLTLNADGTLDGVQMAIINKRMEAICAKMANTLLRTGRSGVLNSARDFSCCIVTAENRLLTVNESLPIHVLRGADMMCESMQEFHPDLTRGDAYLHNSPYHGCSHPPITPRWCRCWTTKACTASPWSPRLTRRIAAIPSPPPITAARATCTRKAR